MEILKMKKILDAVKNIFSKYGMKLYFILYLLFSIRYLFMVQYNKNFETQVIFGFLFWAVIMLSNLVSLSDIFNNRKTIKNFNNTYKRYMKDNRLSTSQKEKLLEILLKEDKADWKFYSILLIQMILPLIISIWLYYLHRTFNPWEVYINIYSFSVFLLYFPLFDLKNKINELYKNLK